MRYSNLSRLVFFGFVAVAGFFIVAEHRAHLVPFLPFLLIAACPLMHLFHHHGHGERDDQKREPPEAISHRQ
jgi:high-affinity Fe2+/Pb2+ permease